MSLEIINMLNIFAAQITTEVANLDANKTKIIDIIQSANEEVDLILFPELCVTGYPPKDLLLRQDFLEQVQKACNEIIAATKNTTAYVVFGAPVIHKIGGQAINKQAINGQEIDKQEINQQRIKLFNQAIICQAGNLITSYNKQILANNGVFDELRYFSSGNQTCTWSLQNRHGETVKVGILICEDVWQESSYKIMPEIDLLLVINASPFSFSKLEQRLKVVEKAFKALEVPLIYLNSVGAEDHLIFDGGSFGLDNAGLKPLTNNLFQEELIACSFNLAAREFNVPLNLPLDLPLRNSYNYFSKNLRVYGALKLGIKNYFKRNGFEHIILGLSGGIDSAVCLALAVAAVGCDKVIAVMMASEFTSQESLDLAILQANNLRVKLMQVPIKEQLKSFEEIFQDLSVSENLDLNLKGLAHENLQARLRGNILMALSVQYKALVLSTANKSEFAVGYSTLYGDMVGGLAPIYDLYKTEVYELAYYINSLDTKNIPEQVITRAPSAELARGQKDSDSLPEYSLLDGILRGGLEDSRSQADLYLDFDKKQVDKVFALIYKNEFKRNQASCGLKVSDVSFNYDRRYPITYSR